MGLGKKLAGFALRNALNLDKEDVAKIKELAGQFSEQVGAAAAKKSEAANSEPPPPEPEPARQAPPPKAEKDPIWLRRMFHSVFSVSSFASGQPAAEESPAPTSDANTQDDDERNEMLAVDPFVGSPLLLGKFTDEDARTGTLVLPASYRGRHVYLIGKTRTGKTTLLTNMMSQDIEAGFGLAYLDPHGDAAQELLGMIPEERIDDVLYFDPTSPTAPAFNPFRLPYPPAKLTEDFLSVFRALFGFSSGDAPRMEHLLRYGLLTLFSHPKPHSLRHLRLLYVDDRFRESVVDGLTNEALREFWEQEFPKVPANAVQPIVNKLSAFLAPLSPLEAVFSRTENDLDFSKILGEGKILIVNLSKGELGDEPSRLLGGLFTAAIQQAAMARASLAQEERRPFYFYVDEFQNFTVASFATILAEASKYKLFLTLANQNLGQIPSLRDAIFGNVATFIAFQVSADDAPALRREMHRTRCSVRIPGNEETYSLEDFVNTQAILYDDAAERAFTYDMWRTGLSDSDIQKVENMGTNAHTNFILRRQKEFRAMAERLRSSEPLPIPVLKELFPDFRFQEDGFPTVENFVNLQPHHAFCRIGRAEDVFPLTTFPPPPVHPSIKAKILSRQQSRPTPATSPAEKKSRAEVPEEPEGFAF